VLKLRSFSNVELYTRDGVKGSKNRPWGVKLNCTDLQWV